MAGEPALVRVDYAWRRQLVLLAVVAAGAGWAVLSTSGRPATVPVAVQLAIVAALVLVVAGVAAVKGRRAGIEVSPEGVVVRRCWLPNRRIDWGQVGGSEDVFKSVGSKGPVCWLTYIAVTIDGGRRAKTLGLATMQWSRKNTPARVDEAMGGAVQQLGQLDPRLVHGNLRYLTSMATSGRVDEVMDLLPDWKKRMGQ